MPGGSSGCSPTGSGCGWGKGCVPRASMPD
jgi:hypothetical protein